MDNIDRPSPGSGEFIPRIPTTRNITAESAKATTLNQAIALFSVAGIV
jgi:hypothetical protein